MSLRINTNVEAFNAHRQLVGTQTLMSQSMEKLSSGLRINRAADDAAGLAISEKMRAQINGIDRAHQNAMDGISMVQTGEGALNEVHSILQRVRELAVQYNNGTLSTADRAAITAEITQLSAEVGRIVNTTQFNGISLLSGGTNVTFQVGANAGETITLANANLGGTYFDSVFATGFGVTADISSMDAAINNIIAESATAGALVSGQFATAMPRLFAVFRSTASYPAPTAQTISSFGSRAISSPLIPPRPFVKTALTDSPASRSASSRLEYFFPSRTA